MLHDRGESPPGRDYFKSVQLMHRNMGPWTGEDEGALPEPLQDWGEFAREREAGELDDWRERE